MGRFCVQENISNAYFSFGRVINDIIRSLSGPPESVWPQKTFISLQGKTAVVWGVRTLSECNNNNISQWEKNMFLCLWFWRETYSHVFFPPLWTFNIWNKLNWLAGLHIGYVRDIKVYSYKTGLFCPLPTFHFTGQRQEKSHTHNLKPIWILPAQPKARWYLEVGLNFTQQTLALASMLATELSRLVDHNFTETQKRTWIFHHG